MEIETKAKELLEKVKQFSDKIDEDVLECYQMASMMFVTTMATQQELSPETVKDACSQFVWASLRANAALRISLSEEALKQDDDMVEMATNYIIAFHQQQEILNKFKA